MNEYNIENQKLFLGFLITDKDLWIRSSTIIKIEYFHKTLQKVMQFIIDYVGNYNGIPSPEQIKASTNIDISLIEQITDSDRDWFLDNIEKFCKRKAFENLALASIKYIEEENYGQYENEMKEALLISLGGEVGINYWEDPKGRLMRILANNGQVSTGFTELDKVLFGGFNRGELNIFIAQSSGGKSVMLQNLALNYAINERLNVIYITLEMAEELIAKRMDSMLSDTPSENIYKKLDFVNDTVKIKGRNAGEIQIKALPQQSRTNQIKAYLKEYEIEKGIRPDVLLVDYLDLVMPNDKRINPSDVFTKDKYASEELRGIANEIYPEKKLLLVTASQLNRGAVDEIEYNHASIAGGISKISTADNLIAIQASLVLKQRQRMQLQMLKTRNSDGDGKRIELKYNTKTLMLSDIPEDEIEEEVDIFEKMRKKNKISRNDKKEDISSNVLTILNEINEEKK